MLVSLTGGKRRICDRHNQPNAIDFINTIVINTIIDKFPFCICEVQFLIERCLPNTFRVPYRRQEKS